MPSQSNFLDFIRLVVNGDIDEVTRRLAANPSLATTPAAAGAARGGSSDFFFTEIAHYMYAKDTALHMAAAAFRRPMAELLIAHGASCDARNRRGAQPLHYAADTHHWDPPAQVRTIKYLLRAGANPDAVDMNGVAPLHRAVRTGSSLAVRALLDGGANPEAETKAGSSPMFFATHGTGASGSGSDRAHRERQKIVSLLDKRAGNPDGGSGRRS